MELIRVEQRSIAGTLIQTCNARDLHAFLGVGKDFSNWFKAQIKRARLMEGRDYVRDFDSPKRANHDGPGGDRRSVDFHVTIDAGKHIAMMSGTEKGFEVREYFLECERRAVAAHGSLHGMTTSLEAVAYEAGKRGAHDAIREALPAMIHEAMLRQHGGFVPRWTAGDVVGEVLDGNRKGLKGLSQMVSRRLVSFHMNKGVAIEKGKLGANEACLFDQATCREWLRKGGRTLIDRYAQMRRGQGELGLVVPIRHRRKKGMA